MATTNFDILRDELRELCENLLTTCTVTTRMPDKDGLPSPDSETRPVDFDAVEDVIELFMSDLEDLADEINLPPATLNRLVKEGKLPKFYEVSQHQDD